MEVVWNCILDYVHELALLVAEYFYSISVVSRI